MPSNRKLMILLAIFVSVLKFAHGMDRAEYNAYLIPEFSSSGEHELPDGFFFDEESNKSYRLVNNTQFNLAFLFVSSSFGPSPSEANFSIDQRLERTANQIYDLIVDKKFFTLELVKQKQTYFISPAMRRSICNDQLSAYIFIIDNEAAKLWSNPEMLNPIICNSLIKHSFLLGVDKLQQILGVDKILSLHLEQTFVSKEEIDRFIYDENFPKPNPGHRLELKFAHSDGNFEAIRALSPLTGG